MSNQSRLEFKGSLCEHPLAELLIETTEASLTGSFRVSNGDQKMIIYLNQGEVVFAVSNMREHRLYSVALTEGLLSDEQVRSVSNVANDMELSDYLVENNFATQKDIHALTTKQINAILDHCLGWVDGEWAFNSLARIKTGINYSVDLNGLLVEFARKLKPDFAVSRIKADAELFGIKSDSPFHINLQSHEAFVLSRFESEFVTVGDLDIVSGLPADVTRQVLYILWLGGFLFRKNWDSVLSEERIASMLDAKLKLVVETKSNEPVMTPVETTPAPELSDDEAKAIKEELQEIDEEQALYAYLERVESAITLYETIGVERDAEKSQIKQAYFALAKKYHPDLFYKNADLHLRMQVAFTNLAQAYETLKERESRELYDFKMRKELAEIAERQKAGISETEASLNKQAEKAAENFQWGMNLLEEDEAREALQFFARAIHFDPNTAKYHAYYGKALSADNKSFHKAEGEIQNALRIEPENLKYRFMLAELFVQIGLKKRAEGELNRILLKMPGDKDALALLDSVLNK
jgi:tetratricopeptide (TPR) repeat protein